MGIGTGEAELRSGDYFGPIAICRGSVPRRGRDRGRSVSSPGNRAEAPYVAMSEALCDVLSLDRRSHRIRRCTHDLYIGSGFEVSDTTVFRKIARSQWGG
jgi:hypothetical protein